MGGQDEHLHALGDQVFHLLGLLGHVGISDGDLQVDAKGLGIGLHDALVANPPFFTLGRKRKAHLDGSRTEAEGQQGCASEQHGTDEGLLHE